MFRFFTIVFLLCCFFVQIENGEPVGHPIQEDNFVHSYPDISKNDLPPNFAEFIRNKQPKIGIYEKIDGYTYIKTGRFWTCTWNVVSMTADEIKNKQDNVYSKHSYMIFNEETCSYKYPLPYPIVEGKKFRWSEITNNWEEVYE